jgi:hypothetical protein
MDGRSKAVPATSGASVLVGAAGDAVVGAEFVLIDELLVGTS